VRPGSQQAWLQRRARCPQCSEPVKVNNDGTFRRHPHGKPPASRCAGTGMQAGLPQARILTWDWKGQINLAKLAEAVYEVSGRGVIIREVDTGGDFYMLVISDHVVSDEEAEGLPVS
jgi:hypothetical protein